MVMLHRMDGNMRVQLIICIYFKTGKKMNYSQSNHSNRKQSTENQLLQQVTNTITIRH